MMKKLCIIFALIIPWFAILKSQDNHCLDSIMYERAYNYIIADSLWSGSPINVSKKMIGSCYFCFFNELKGNEDIKSHYMRLIDLDKKYAVRDSVYFYINNKQFIENTNSKFTLFFSRIINNSELFAEVYMNEFVNTQMGEIVYYYIKFDLDGSICFTLKKKMYGL